MKIITEYPIIYDSWDYIEPIGAINDDNYNELYVDEIEAIFGRKVSYLELGCAGGTLIDLMVNKGHDAYGIEGTDYPLNNGNASWNKWYYKRLFTCDLSKPFYMEDNPLFDVVSAWEFMEHIPPYSIHHLLAKIYQILDNNGVIYFGISTSIDKHHLSVFNPDFWKTEYFDLLYETYDYPLKNKYREDYNGGFEQHKSFFVMLRKKQNLDYIATSIITEYETTKIFTNIK